MKVENGWAFSPEVMTILSSILPELPGLYVGWSLGGMKLLDRVLDGDTDIKALVLVGSTLSFRQRQDALYGTPEQQLRAIRIALKTQQEKVLETFCQQCFSPDSGPNWRDVLHTDTDLLTEGIAQLDRFDFTKATFPADLPVLVLHGTEDQVTSPEAAQPLADRFGTQPVYIEGAGHALPLTHSELVAAHILHFVETLGE